MLRRNAPHGIFTDDGFLYIRVPKKFIDFTRAGKGAAGGDDASPAADEEPSSPKAKRSARASKKSAPSYDLSSEHIWKVKLDGESEESGRDTTVVLDVLDPLENM